MLESGIMKKLLAIVVLGLLFSNLIFAKERSEKEIKMGVFLEDLKSIGTFKKIDDVPAGLFDKKYLYDVIMSITN